MFFITILLLISCINSYKMISINHYYSKSSLSLQMEFDNASPIRGQWQSIGIPGQFNIQRIPDPEPEDSTRQPCLKIEGPFNSIEFYTCQRATQGLVSSHIANWAEIGECYTLRDKGTHSVVFSSVDGRRVVHMFGWALDGRELLGNYHDFKVRADSADGTPAALKESTHMYRTVWSIPQITTGTFFKSMDIEEYPLYSIDLYTARMPENIKDIQSQLINASNAINKHMVPDLIGMHVLKSIDNLSCILLGTWSNLYGYECLSQIKEYDSAIEEAKKLSAFGTMSDILHKTDPRRMFYVSNICLPDKIKFFR